MTAPVEVPADITEAIRAIRRLASPSFVRHQIATGAADRATVEVLPFLRNIRPDRFPEAAQAHRALIKQVCSDLRENGYTDPVYPQLVFELYAYLRAGDFLFGYESGGSWENHNCPPGETVIL